MSTDHSGNLLSLVEVRKIATAVGCQELESKSADTLSFLVTPTVVNNDCEEPARIQVYCKTGTVGICRILNEEVRESFHQKCNLNTVKKLLRQPPDLTMIDPEVIFRSNDDTPGSVTDPHCEAVATGKKRTDLQWKENILRDAETVDIALSILAGENQSILSHLTSLRRTQKEIVKPRRTKKKTIINIKAFGSYAVGRRRKPGMIDNTKIEKTITNKKQEIAYSLPATNIEKVKKGLKDAFQGDVLSCIATTGPQSVFLYRNGKWAATGNILKEKLKTHKKVKYVSLGVDKRYFIILKGGQIIWDGPNSMKKYLETKLEIRCVAFGGKRDTFFVVYTDGSWKHEGSEIPMGLTMLLRDRGASNDITSITMGPSGEWFLQVENGDVWWGGVSKRIDNLFHSLTTGKDIKVPRLVVFGKHGSFIMTYG